MNEALDCQGMPKVCSVVDRAVDAVLDLLYNESEVERRTLTLQRNCFDHQILQAKGCTCGIQQSDRKTVRIYGVRSLHSERDLKNRRSARITREIGLLHHPGKGVFLVLQCSPYR